MIIFQSPQEVEHLNCEPGVSVKPPACVPQPDYLPQPRGGLPSPGLDGQSDIPLDCVSEVNPVVPSHPWNSG